MASNRGEWAEIYTALKLLSEGKLYLADDQGNKKIKEYMEIIELIRHEAEKRIVNYNYDPSKTDICISVNNNKVITLPVLTFKSMADALAKEIKKGTGAFNIDKRLDCQIKKAEFHSIKAKSIDKSDIFISVIDPRSSLVRREIGFSIKSEFNTQPSTLFNTGKSSAAIYKLSNMTDTLAKDINKIVNNRNKAAVTPRCQKLLSCGCNPTFVGFEETPKFGFPVFQENLDLINPRLPCVIEKLMFNHFFLGSKETNLKEALKPIITKNLSGLRNPEFKYNYMLKAFIYACYCGLTAATPWNGLSEVNGGFIKVTKSGEVLAFYAMESESFKNYLFSHCFLDFPSTSEKHGDYGYVYKENGEYFFKLNFQIRYK